MRIALYSAECIYFFTLTYLELTIRECSRCVCILIEEPVSPFEGVELLRDKM